MNPEEKRAAVLISAAEEIEKKKLGGQQAWLTIELAKVINKFLDKHPSVKLELTCAVLDTLTETMCVSVFDDAEADGRVQRISTVAVVQ